MSVKTQSIDLASAAQEIFQRALRSAYPADAMKSFVHCDRQSLSIGDEIFDLHHYQKIYSVAYGKAAFPMAQSLSGLLGEKLVRGVISCPSNNEKLSDEWQIFHGGHPVPNEDSLSAARAALALLNETDAPDSLIIFLVSGGGSAMLELPVSDSITLADLQRLIRF